MSSLLIFYMDSWNTIQKKKKKMFCYVDNISTNQKAVTQAARPRPIFGPAVEDRCGSSMVRFIWNGKTLVRGTALVPVDSQPRLTAAPLGIELTLTKPMLRLLDHCWALWFIIELSKDNTMYLLQLVPGWRSSVRPCCWRCMCTLLRLC